MIGGVGLLPVGECARCGLRGIPLALSSCPRCGAVDGWLLINRYACAAFLVALWDEQRETVRRLVEYSHEQILAAVQDQQDHRTDSIAFGLHSLDRAPLGRVYDLNEPSLLMRQARLAHEYGLGHVWRAPTLT